MDNLIKMLREISSEIESDTNTLIRLKPKISSEFSMRLVADMCGITCIVNLKLDMVNETIDHVYNLTPEWIRKNHNCEKKGDHDKFLSALVLWARDESESFLFPHKDILK